MLLYPRYAQIKLAFVHVRLMTSTFLTPDCTSSEDAGEVSLSSEISMVTLSLSMRHCHERC